MNFAAKITGLISPQKSRIMIIFAALNLKKIFKLKEKYPWPRPEICPNCMAHKVWGHGFVLAYFDGFASGILIRRYRCPNCSTVFRMRPVGYLPRFQATLETIRSSICNKEMKERWLSGLNRTRQQHWFRGIVRRAKAFLGNTWKDGMVKAFDYFISKIINPVSRSFKSVTFSSCILPTEG